MIISCSIELSLKRFYNGDAWYFHRGSQRHEPSSMDPYFLQYRLPKWSKLPDVKAGTIYCKERRNNKMTQTRESLCFIVGSYVIVFVLHNLKRK